MDNQQKLITDLITEIKKIFPKLFINSCTDNNLIFKPELDDGYVEYKRTLKDCNGLKFVKYATQMQWRITENLKNQCAIYYVGVDDDGTIIGLDINEISESIVTFISIAKTIKASIVNLKIINVGNKIIYQVIVKNKKMKDNFLIPFEN